MIYPSDVIGGIGGIGLAIPALKDQYYRFRQADEERRSRLSPWPKLRLVLSKAWGARRDAYDGWDSAITATGSIAIVIAFGLKMLDM